RRRRDASDHRHEQRRRGDLRLAEHGSEEGHPHRALARSGLASPPVRRLRGQPRSQGPRLPLCREQVPGGAMSDTLFGSLAKELGALLFPLQRAATVPGALDAMLAELGALPDTDTTSLAPAIAAVVDVKNQLEALAEQPAPSLDEIGKVLDASLHAFDTI